MAQSTAVICGLARDCETSLRNLIPQIEQVGSAFGHYTMIVVENDSQDGTPAILERWAARNDAVELIRFCYMRDRSQEHRTSVSDGVFGWFGSDRIKRMAFARNLYLDASRTVSWPWEYLVVIDLDVRSISLRGIQYSFGVREAWDIATANGVRYSLRHPIQGSVYWDTYAFESVSGFPLGVQTLNHIREAQVAVKKELLVTDLVPARSAFGGLGIYRRDHVGTAKYAPLPNADKGVPVLCEHHAFHRSIFRENSSTRLMISAPLRVRYASVADLARRAVGRLAGQE